MEPRFETRDSEHGVIYQGRTFPLDEKLIRQATADKSRKYQDLINQHQQASRERVRQFYYDFAIIMAGLALGGLLLSFILHKRNR